MCDHENCFPSRERREVRKMEVFNERGGSGRREMKEVFSRAGKLFSTRTREEER